MNWFEQVSALMEQGKSYAEATAMLQEAEGDEDID